MKQCTDALAFLAQELDDLEREGLRRRPAEPAAADSLSFCSNDYLGLASSHAPRAPGGAGASRLISGDRQEHRRAEQAFAAWLGAEDALLFTSGYAANVGVLSALARPGDLIVSDVLNHASLIDGARLSRARVAVIPHGDLSAVERTLGERREARAWVAVESYFSMDADGPDLPALRRLCDAHGAALLVDEAHALGVLGPGGRGRCAEAGVRADVLVGTLGKSFGSQGALVLGATVLREWLWNRARSFVFSTGASPAAAAAATANLSRLLEQPELPGRVLGLAERLRAGLLRSGAVRLDRGARAGDARDARPLLLGFGHIVPVVVGDPGRAVAIVERLQAEGVAAHAVRPPTVPAGTSRLRLTVTARHDEADVDRAVDALARALAHA